MSWGSHSSGIRPLLERRDAVLLLAAALVSQTGDWILSTGVAFEVYALTGSTVASAALMLASLVPLVLVGSAAGVLVDRRDRRHAMIAANLVLATLLAPLVLVGDAARIWIVVAVVAASACVSPFFLAAEASLLPSLVPDSLLVTANATNGQLRSVARLLGAAAGGLLVAASGFAGIAIADAASFTVAAVLLVAIRHRATPVAAGPRRAARDWALGLAVIRERPTLTVVLAVFVLTGVGEGTMGVLFAPFVRDVLHGDGTAYGVVLSAQSVGGIAGGVAVTAVGHRFGARSLLAAGALGLGTVDLGLFLVPLALPSVPVAAGTIALAGVPAAAFSAGLITLFQTATPEAFRGRVFGAMTAAQNAAMLAGTVAAGLAAAGIGLIPLLVLQSCAYLASGALALARRGPRPVTA